MYNTILKFPLLCLCVSEFHINFSQWYIFKFMLSFGTVSCYIFSSLWLPNSPICKMTSGRSSLLKGTELLHHYFGTRLAQELYISCRSTSPECSFERNVKKTTTDHPSPHSTSTIVNVELLALVICNIWTPHLLIDCCGPYLFSSAPGAFIFCSTLGVPLEQVWGFLKGITGWKVRRNFIL